jgi:hypothetical protein
MLTKISGLARALYIVLAIIAGFVALGGLDVALVLIVLGLIAGISMPRERLVLAMAAVIALPLVGEALTHVPTIGAQLNAVMANLQLGIAGAATSALTIMLYGLVMEGVTGLTSAPAPARVATTYRRFGKFAMGSVA